MQDFLAFFLSLGCFFMKKSQKSAIGEIFYKFPLVYSPKIGYNEFNSLKRRNFSMQFIVGLAQEANPASSWLTIGMLVVVFVVFYFFAIRPQKKQEKEQNAMRNNLTVGDEITTIGGIIGKVVSIKEETCVIETTHERTKIRLLKSAISRVDVKAEDAEG